MTSDDLLAALNLLASADHFDEARRAAASLPSDVDVAAVLRAADGAEQIARALDIRRRVDATAHEIEHAEHQRAVYSDEQQVSLYN